jgi:hypothetical protein
MQIKVFRKTAGTPFLATKSNEEILEDLKAEPFDQKLRRYKSN